MIGDKDTMAAGFAAADAERRRDLARAEGLGAPAERTEFAKKTPPPTEKIRGSGRGFTPAKRGYTASQTMAKAAGSKGVRPAAHGHSRHQ